MTTTQKLFFVLGTLLLVEVALSDVVYNIQVNPNTVAAVQWNQNVNITFDYKTSQAGGVRIFARPMSGNALSASYAASGSPLLTGTGSGSQSFTITSGNAVVDKIRFQVYDANQTQLLLEFYVPVKFYFGSHAITNIQISPATYASLQFNENVNITFDYKTTQAGGVRIFPRPMTGSALSANYAASGSPLYATGAGTGSGFFTISAGNITVDGIRFQMWDANQTTLLSEFVVPVEYKYAASAISNIILTPATPDGLLLNANAAISFNYRTTQPGGVRIFARPFSNGALTPSYAASGSPLYATGAGTGNGTFTITGGSVTVDSIRFQMWDANQTQLLLEWFVPASIHFASSKITGITFNPTSAAYFTLNERENMAFSYVNNQSGGVRIFVLPYYGGSFLLNSGVSPSPLYAAGSGAGTGFVTIVSGSAVVDRVQFKMTNDSQSATYIDWRVPVKFYYGSQLLTDVRPVAGDVPKEFELSQNYPNPFNPSTTIAFRVATRGMATLQVFDILGKEVATLVNESLEAGRYETHFDAKNLASGTYVYRLQSADGVSAKKMVLMK